MEWCWPQRWGVPDLRIPARTCLKARLHSSSPQGNLEKGLGDLLVLREASAALAHRMMRFLNGQWFLTFLPQLGGVAQSPKPSV